MELSREEELGLITAYQNDKDREALKKLFTFNGGLVAKIAYDIDRSYKLQGKMNRDLIQEGYCGLQRAIDVFDTQSTNRLSTVAYNWIHVSIIKYVRGNMRLIRIPYNNYGIFGEYLKSGEDEETFANNNKISLSLLKEIIYSFSFSFESLELSTHENVENCNVTEKEAIKGQLNEKIHKIILENLDEFKIKILTMRYRDDMVFREIGEKLNCSFENVRCHHNRALKILKGVMEKEEMHLFL